MISTTCTGLCVMHEQREMPPYYVGPAKGAVTVNPSGQILAEGRLLRGTGTAAVIEEYHYSGSGSLIFRCESLIDDYGVKRQESHTAGKKQRDYYFLWPVSH